MTANRVIDTQLTARVNAGPLPGLHGSIVSTTPQGKTYFRLHDLPGVTVLIPSHLLQPTATAKPAN